LTSAAAMAAPAKVSTDKAKILVHSGILGSML